MSLTNIKSFFATVRSTLFNGRLTSAQVNTLERILVGCQQRGVTDLRHIAYIMATVYHEVGPALQPVSENLNYSAQGLANNWPHRYAVDPKAKLKKPNALALKLHRKPEAIANNCYSSRMGNGDEKSGDGWKFRGRDFCQTTGKSNYERAGMHAGVDLVKYPERIAEVDIAICTLVCGMRDGWFTSRRLSHYLTPGKTDFVNARRIINGTDKAETIAATARKFYNALIAE
jgi:putative chitinase